MAAAPTYGVTPAVVAARIHGFVPSSTTKPSSTQVEEFIAQAASYWRGLLVSLAVSPDSFSPDSTATGYKVSAQYITLAACVETVRANERSSTPMLLSFEASLKQLEDRVVKRPSLLTEGQPVTPAANTAASHVSLATSIEAPAPLGARMARNGVF